MVKEKWQNKSHVLFNKLFADHSLERGLKRKLVWGMFTREFSWGKVMWKEVEVDQAKGRIMLWGSPHNDTPLQTCSAFWRRITLHSYPQVGWRCHTFTCLSHLGQLSWEGCELGWGISQQLANPWRGWLTAAYSRPAAQLRSPLFLSGMGIWLVHHRILQKAKEGNFMLRIADSWETVKKAFSSIHNILITVFCALCWELRLFQMIKTCPCP